LSLVELAEPIQENSLELPPCSTSGDSNHTRPLCFEGPSQCQKPPAPKFSRFVCSPHEVETFLWMMIQAYGLSYWWGRESKHNEEIVRNNIHRIVNLRMFEKISLHELAQNLKFKACDQWISRNAQDHHSEEMLHDFLWWFYFSFIGGLIKNTFFVTESASFRNRTLYFRLDDWDQICRPLIKYLKTSLFTKVDENSMVSG